VFCTIISFFPLGLSCSQVPCHLAHLSWGRPSPGHQVPRSPEDGIVGGPRLEATDRSHLSLRVPQSGSREEGPLEDTLPSSTALEVTRLSCVSQVLQEAAVLLPSPFLTPSQGFQEQWRLHCLSRDSKGKVHTRLQQPALAHSPSPGLAKPVSHQDVTVLPIPGTGLWGTEGTCWLLPHRGADPDLSLCPPTLGRCVVP
jgi:hypothetical protein